jgi:hypothetical protein
VLDHADAGHGIERLLVELAVVGDADLDGIVYPRLLGTAAGELRLGSGQGYAKDPRAVPGGGVDCKAAPAAADVEHPFAGTQGELRAGELELRLLGLLERACPAREDRAAVGQ